MRRAARRDANEAAIVRVLRAAGCAVARLSEKGVPDLLVNRHGRLWLLEVKDGAKAKSHRKLTAAQIVFHEQWAGAPVHVVTSVDDALRLLRDG